MTAPKRIAILTMLAALSATAAAALPRVRAQEPDPESLLVRDGPKPLEDFESDESLDGVPDGWYNLRDAVLTKAGGVVGPRCLRFETGKPGRPARASRAFGVDGRATEALVIGLWVRLEKAGSGERLGEDPGLVIDFLGEGLKSLRRGMMGPWHRSVGRTWTHVAKRIPVPPGTRDAILSLGLIGATGLMDVDGLSIDLVPVGGRETTNLAVNPDFELGDPAPAGWGVESGARRVFPGYRSTSALELGRSGARALTGLAQPVEGLGRLEIRVRVKAQSLRGAGGAAAAVFFLDEFGRAVPGFESGLPAFRWSGGFDWRLDAATVQVPPGAQRAVLQFEKLDGLGWIRVDDVEVTAAPHPLAGEWTPFHAEDDVNGWQPVTPSTHIEADSALDVSFLLDAPAGKHGFVRVRDGRLAFEKAGRTRFHGVTLIPPTPFQDAARTDALIDRLARSGVNLVRLGDLDTPIGPGRSVIDDSRDDTRGFDAISLQRLDHFVAACKRRGIYVAFELLGARRFRQGDEVADTGLLPVGGGPAAIFDPIMMKRQKEFATGLMEHVNAETGVAYRDEPAVAWVTLAGEVSLFNQIEDARALPAAYVAPLKDLARTSNALNSRKLWQTLETEHWKELADALRADKVRMPIAASSHWRREAEYASMTGSNGFDLIDDRLFWSPPPFLSPDVRSALWSLDGGFLGQAARKRKADRPYVVGQWCPQTSGNWALPTEAGDVMLAAVSARAEGWDALTRRGIFILPEQWGANAAGTSGGEDMYQIPEATNGVPQVFALWPHVASLLLRKSSFGSEVEHAATNTAPRAAGTGAVAKAKAARRLSLPGWDPARGRLVIDTPHTQGLVGWPGGEAADLSNLTIDVESPFAVVVVTSLTSEPIGRSKRLLLTAIARIEPTGYKWVDSWRREVADPGIPPLLQEPVRARIVWKGKRPVRAHALNNNGTRTGVVPLAADPEGVAIVIDGSKPILHYELIAE